MKKVYYQPYIEVLPVVGNKTLLESPGGGGGVNEGTDGDPVPPFGGGSVPAPYRY